MIITRDTFTTKTSIGNLIVPDTRFTCYTLEDVARALGIKIFKETAICAGKMKCRINHSTRFDRLLPLIYNTDTWSVSDGFGASWIGIRMHNGVNHLNTDGCVLTGYEKGIDCLAQPAADDLVKVLLEKYGENKEFEIEIINRPTRA